MIERVRGKEQVTETETGEKQTQKEAGGGGGEEEEREPRVLRQAG